VQFFANNREKQSAPGPSFFDAQEVRPRSVSIRNSQLHARVAGGSAFVFALALRHGRRTDIGTA
jgi:hypothetical protein